MILASLYIQILFVHFVQKLKKFKVRSYLFHCSGTSFPTCSVTLNESGYLSVPMDQ